MASLTSRLSIIAITLTIISMAIYAFALNTALPWHPLQQIALSPTSSQSLDENNNGRIDSGIIEDTLQDITNNGASTTNPITVGGLTSNGGIVVSGNAVFNGNVRLPSIICGAGKRLHTDANGNIVCGNNDDDPSNEIQTLTKSSNQICLSNSGGCVVDEVNDADADPNNELQTLAQVLQRGNNAGGRSITGVGSLSTSALTIDSATLDTKYVSGIGTMLELKGVSGLITANDKAGIGVLYGRGTVAAEQICLGGECKTSWSQIQASVTADDILSKIKVCYCIWCKEGGDHHNSGWMCSSDGFTTGPSDDGAAPEGCQMKIKLVPKYQACTW